MLEHRDHETRKYWCNPRGHGGGILRVQNAREWGKRAQRFEHTKEHERGGEPRGTGKYEKRARGLERA